MKFFKDTISTMKIRYKLSNLTTQNADLLRSRIMAALTRKSYLITSDAIDKVGFKADKWLFRSSIAHFASIDEGEFHISEKGGQTELTFMYYITFDTEILFMIGILVISYIMADYRMIPFAGIPLWIHFAVRFLTLRDVGDEMLEEIVTGIVG